MSLSTQSSLKQHFTDHHRFIKWRAAIMELSVQKLKLDQVTEPIPEGGEDPYQMIQVHDYMNVSFWRMDPAVKAASKETIHVFSMAYPELLAHKYFVNVPAIMGWMFGAMKLFLAPATLKKFHPMTSGTTLATELKSIVSTLPNEYGGQGPSVKEGLAIPLTDAEETPKEQDKEEPKDLETETQPAVASTEKPVEEAKPAEVTLPIREEKPLEENPVVENKLTEDTKPVTEELKPISEEAKTDAVTPEVAKPAAETNETVPTEGSAPAVVEPEKKAAA